MISSDYPRCNAMALPVPSSAPTTGWTRKHLLGLEELRADEITLLGRGQCVWRGEPQALIEDTEVHQRWLGV